MITRYEETDHSPGPKKEREPEETPAAEIKDDACRCKETAGMTPRELIRLMVSDLAFWVKAKKG